MKTKILSIITICFFVIAFNNSYSQEQSANFKQFNNFTSTFEVPSGKTWIVQQIFSSYTAEVVTNPDGSSSIVPVRIFIKTLNGDIKTDWQGNRFGPQVFQSNNTSATIQYPITLPAGTKFSLVIVKGDPGKCTAFDGSGYISFYEVTNN